MNIPRTDNETVIALLMLRVEVLIAMFYGSRPLPTAKVKAIGRDIVSKSTFDNKEELQRLLDQQIDAAFSRQ